MIKRNSQAFENMFPCLGLLQVILCPPPNDIFLMIQIILQDLFQAQYLWRTIDNRHHVEGKTGLQRCQFVEIIQNNRSTGIAADINDNPHPITIGFITQGDNAVDFLFMDQIGNPFHHLGFVDHVRNFGNNDPFAPGLFSLNVDFTTQHNRSAAVFVCVANTGLAHNNATGWKIGSRQCLHQVGGGGIRMIHQHMQGRNRFRQIMRRNIGGHPNRNPGRTVDQQIREARWQNNRFFFGAVVIILKINRVFVDVA